jgi:hypothetical protein
MSNEKIGLKAFNECFNVDLSNYILKKPTFFKGQDGKMQKTSEDKWLDYVEWATILTSLYIDCGANSVTWKSELHKDKINTLTITVIIDGKENSIDYPMIDGNAILQSPNQLQIHKCELRGFVKCVAVHTGLGLKLWLKEEKMFDEGFVSEKKFKNLVQTEVDEILKLTDAIEINTRATAIHTKLNDAQKLLIKNHYAKYNV